MFDLAKQFATDREKETSGVWIDVGLDSSILVARTNNRAYARAITREYEKYKLTLSDDSETSDELSDQIMAKIIAKTILLDWKSFSDDGKNLPYSVEAAEAVLLKYPDFKSFVMQQANDIENFRRNRAKVAEKK